MPYINTKRGIMGIPPVVERFNLVMVPGFEGLRKTNISFCALICRDGSLVNYRGGGVALFRYWTKGLISTVTGVLADKFLHILLEQHLVVRINSLLKIIHTTVTNFKGITVKYLM